MWMVSEYRRYRGVQLQPFQPVDQRKKNALLGATWFELDEESAGTDLAAAVWLSLSPTLADQQVPITTWCREVGKAHKLPMAFLYGEGKADLTNRMAESYLSAIAPGYRRGQKIGDKDKELKFTGEKIYNAKLVGSKLLQTDLEVDKFITDSYLKPVVANDRPPQWKNRDNKNNFYFWELPMPMRGHVLSWNKGEDLPKNLPPSLVGIRR